MESLVKSIPDQLWMTFNQRWICDCAVPEAEQRRGWSFLFWLAKIISENISSSDFSEVLGRLAFAAVSWYQLRFARAHCKWRDTRDVIQNLWWLLGVEESLLIPSPCARLDAHLIGLGHPDGPVNSSPIDMMFRLSTDQSYTTLGQLQASFGYGMFHVLLSFAGHGMSLCFCSFYWTWDVPCTFVFAGHGNSICFCFLLDMRCSIYFSFLLDMGCSTCFWFFLNMGCSICFCVFCWIWDVPCTFIFCWI